ncbi:MAG TPA: Crp/Fnr family transcriptional regulator, partial [Blastocatellia bacterium]
TGKRKHVPSEKRRALAAAALANKIGYLRIDDFPDPDIFEDLPARSFNPHKIIRCKEEMMLVKDGLVEIWHTHHDSLVKELGAGVFFGELPWLGQTMLGTKAIAGRQGATVAVMKADTARELVKADPVSIIEKLGQRLAEVEDQHYRSSFQLADSRLAAFLLELAGEGLTVEGLSHDEIGEKNGLFRETVTNVLNTMKLDRIIEIGRRKITILDKRALRELSEL